MRILNREDFESKGGRRHGGIVTAVAFFLGLVALGMAAATPCHASAVPAWLDDAVSEWNKTHPASLIEFMGVSDSFVWYSIAHSTDLQSKDVRARVYGIAYRNGYSNMQDEEIVTTGKPPVEEGSVKTRKCFTRSFLRTVQEGSGSTAQRMLTAMVCEEDSRWAAGFRIIQ